MCSSVLVYAYIAVLVLGEVCKQVSCVRFYHYHRVSRTLVLTPASRWIALILANIGGSFGGVILVDGRICVVESDIEDLLL